MKNKSLLLLLLLYITFYNCYTQNDINYIDNNYYVKKYKAEYAYLKGKKWRAYYILKKIGSIVPLLYQEQERFVELSLLYNNYDKAYKNIYEMLMNYGYKLDDFKHFENFEKLKKEKSYEYEVLVKVENNFSSDTIFWHQIKEMEYIDQFYRTIESSIRYTKIITDSLYNYYKILIDSIDSINYYRLLEIIDKRGYPLSKNIKYTKQQREDVSNALSIIIIHNRGKAERVERLKNILFENIKNGNDGLPDELAYVVDHQYYLQNNGLCFYCSSINITRDEVYDLHNLDKRRAKIGLPSRKLMCKINKLKSIPPEIFKTLPKHTQDILNTPCDL